MPLKQKEIPIKGMHCRSCEILIEDELLKIEGIKKANVSEKNGTAEIFYEGNLSDSTIEKTVVSCGYSIGKEKKSWISTSRLDYYQLMQAGLVLTILYFVAKSFGLFNISFNTSTNLASSSVVFLIGLTAGLSTCMALVGGLVLGVAGKFAEANPHASSLEKFTPHVYFNLGRIFFFTLLGGIIGYFGSFLQLSPALIGVMTIIVGLVMLVLGLQTIGIFPILEKVRFTLPKGVYKVLGINGQKDSAYSNKGSFILGGLTFFLPCGFTQAMQLYAISSGSIRAGALTMGVFALGTTPGLLSVGGLTAVIKGAFAKPFFKFVGLLVVLLSIFNISNGLNLTGVTFPSTIAFANTQSGNTIATDPNVTLENGVQIVKMTQDYNGYSPRSFTIKKGVPVKWVINSVNANTCAASIYSSQLGVRKVLNEGENIIEFTPDQTGTIKFSCSMGMYTGSFNVVDENTISGNTTKQTELTQNTPTTAGGSCGTGGGCGCGARRNVQGTTNTKPVLPTSQNNTTTNGDIQVIKATYSINDDITPNNFSVKVNQPVRIEIEAKDNGYGCMGSIALPGLSQEYYPFVKGQTVVFNFTPTKTGSYQITCAMGVPRGTITVQ